MYATHRLMVKHPCAKYCKSMSNQKNVMGRTQKHVKKPYKFEVKVQGFIWIMNVRNTSSYGDAPMCQIDKPMSNQISQR